MGSKGARQGRKPCLALSMTGHQFISNGEGNLPLGTLGSVASEENWLGGPFMTNTLFTLSSVKIGEDKR